MEKFNYLIGRYWNGRDGEICVYMICNSEIHYGSMEDAKEDLEYVVNSCKEKDWNIFRINAFVV